MPSNDKSIAKDDRSHLQHEQPASIFRIMAAGAVAGLLVDTVLFPIDTIKSRAQSQAGLFASGGFRNIYRGLPSILVGSIPNGKHTCVNINTAAFKKILTT